MTPNPRPPATAEELEADCAYVRSMIDMHIGKMNAAGVSVQGANLVEIGPGKNFGVAVAFKALGCAHVAVVDRFLASWKPQYDPAFYRHLYQVLESREETRGKLPPPQDDMEAWLSSLVTRHHVWAEELTSAIAPGSVDIFLSCAVLEHFMDHARVFNQLAVATRPGGWGFHQVDFRYHGDFDNPLEFLLWDDERFHAWHQEVKGGFGHRVREAEMTELLRGAGFEIRMEPNLVAEPEYLENFLPKLRSAVGSSYRECPADHMRTLGAYYTLRTDTNRVISANRS